MEKNITTPLFIFSIMPFCFSSCSLEQISQIQWKALVFLFLRGYFICISSGQWGCFPAMYTSP